MFYPVLPSPSGQRGTDESIQNTYNLNPIPTKHWISSPSYPKSSGVIDIREIWINGRAKANIFLRLRAKYSNQIPINTSLIIYSFHFGGLMVIDFERCNAISILEWRPFSFITCFAQVPGWITNIPPLTANLISSNTKVSKPHLFIQSKLGI